MAPMSRQAKGVSGITLSVLGFLIGIVLYPIIFHVPHSAKITKVISNYKMANNNNLLATSDHFLFENYDTLEPVILMGAAEESQTKGSGSNGNGKVALASIHLDNLQYILNSNLYAKFSEYSSVYTSKNAETFYSLDKILGKDAQRIFLPFKTERLDIEGRVKSMAQGSFTKKNKGRIYIAMLTDAFEVIMIDRDSKDMLWKVDFKNYLDTSHVSSIDEYVVSIQILPNDNKNKNNENNTENIETDSTAPQGPPTEDGIYPSGKEKKGIVFAVWRMKLIPDMFGQRSILLFVSMDGKTGKIKWASIAQTLDESNVDAFKSVNPEPIYFNLADSDKDEEEIANENSENSTKKSTTKKYERKDSDKVDIVGILSHLAACRLPVSSNSSSVEGYTNSLVLGVSAKKYTTKSINKRSNTNAANKKKNKSTFREIVEASSNGNSELSYKSDTLLFVSPSHIIAADFDKGNYLFGAVLQKGTLLFSVGDVPYAFYSVASCGVSASISESLDNTPQGRIPRSLFSRNRRGQDSQVPCAVLAEVDPQGQIVNKIHWAVTLEDGVVSKKVKAKKTATGKNISTFTGNLIDTPIKPLIFQENVFTPPKLVVLSPSGYLHCYDLNGNTLWARPATCGANGETITLDKINAKSGDYISLSAQQISGKSVVVTTCGGEMNIIWAENGETAGKINVEENFVTSTTVTTDKQVISNIMFSQIAPAPSSPVVAIIKARIPQTEINSTDAQDSTPSFTLPLKITGYYMDIYALSGFDGNASASFFYTVCCVLVAGLLGMILVSSFPPPSVKSD